MAKKCRVIIMVDGYNLYHGIEKIKTSSGDTRHDLKWVSLPKLMHQFIDPAHHEIVEIKYFSAYTNWKADAKNRHRAYVAALKNDGVTVIMGQFRKRMRWCPNCESRFGGHEEKQTDVNIATEMMAAGYEDKFDELFLVSGDTDMVGPIRFLQEKFSDKKIKVIVPPFRGNLELRDCANKYREIKPFHIGGALYPKTIKRAGKNPITRPAKYDPPLA